MSLADIPRGVDKPKVGSSCVSYGELKSVDNAPGGGGGGSQLCMGSEKTVPGCSEVGRGREERADQPGPGERWTRVDRALQQRRRQVVGDQRPAREAVRLDELDEHKGSFTISGFLKLGWTDMRLAYMRAARVRSDRGGRPSSRPSVRPSVRRPFARRRGASRYTPDCADQWGMNYRWLLSKKYHYKLWQRDWYFVNAVDGATSTSERTTSIWIYPTGWVVEKMQISQALKCDLDLRELPFDEQVCEMRIGVSGLTAEKAIFEVPIANIVDTSSGDDVENAQWTIDKVRVYTKRQTYFASTGAGAGADDEYSEAYIEFTFKRKPLFYFVEVVLPAILFLFVAYVGFYIAATVAPARVGVTVIPVLIMRTLLNQTYGRMQIIAYFTRLTNFLIMAQALSVLCVAEFGLRYRKHQRAGYFISLESLEAGQLQVFYMVGVLVFLDEHPRHFPEPENSTAAPHRVVVDVFRVSPGLAGRQVKEADTGRVRVLLGVV